MLILVGNDGTDLKYVKDEARSLSERYRIHDQPPWFSNNVGDPAPLNSDDIKRITFRGHGSKKKFGGYTPEEFFELLKARKQAGDLPDTIETIDLIGCGIGHKVGNNKCWIEKLADLLNTDERFNHIKSINGLIYHDQAKQYAKMVSLKGSTALLFTRENFERYKSLSDQIRTNDARIDSLSHEIELKEQEIESSVEHRHKNSEIADQKEKMRKMINAALLAYKPTSVEGQQFKEKIQTLMASEKFISIRNLMLIKNRPDDFPKEEAIRIIKNAKKLHELKTELKEIFNRLDNGYIKVREQEQDQLENRNKDLTRQIPQMCTFLGATSENPRQLVQRFPNIQRIGESPLSYHDRQLSLPDASEFVQLIEKTFQIDSDESDRSRFLLREDAQAKAGLRNYLDYVNPERSNKWSKIGQENPMQKKQNVDKSQTSRQDLKPIRQEAGQVEVVEVPRSRMRP